MYLLRRNINEKTRTNQQQRMTNKNWYIVNHSDTTKQVDKASNNQEKLSEIKLLRTKEHYELRNIKAMINQFEIIQLQRKLLKPIGSVTCILIAIMTDWRSFSKGFKTTSLVSVRLQSLNKKIVTFKSHCKHTANIKLKFKITLNSVNQQTSN